jgi:flagellar basal-body rod protein FlgB
MSPMRTALFDLAQRRLAWVEQRQSVLARNVANASTPGFQPRDLSSFATTLNQTSLSGPTRTQPNHLGPQGAGPYAERTDRPRARSPDGNAVAMEEQLTKVADTETAQATAITIYRKYMTMFGMALGKV